MEAMVWEWPILVDLWAAGVAGGGFFVAFLVDRFTGRKHKWLLQVATWIGVPLALLGILLLVLDLGNQLWFWHLMIKPGPPFLTFLPLSSMSIGTWVLTIWCISGAALIVLWLADSQVPAFAVLRRLVPLTEFFLWVSFAFSPLVITYTGVLLSSTNVVVWRTMLLPVLFVASAVFTGTAAIQFASILLGKNVPEAFGRASLVLALIQVLALAGFLLTVPSSVLVSHSLAVWFWVGVVVIGLIIPSGLELWTLRAKRTAPLVLASTSCVLVGGLVLRAMVVIGGQM